MERYAELHRGYVGRGVPSSPSYILCSDVLCGYIGENINIEKGHNKGSRIRMMVRCSTIVAPPPLRSVGFVAHRYFGSELRRGIFQ